MGKDIKKAVAAEKSAKNKVAITTATSAAVSSAAVTATDTTSTATASSSSTPSSSTVPAPSTATASSTPLSHFSEQQAKEPFYLRIKITHPMLEFELETKDPVVLEKLVPLLGVVPEMEIAEFQEITMRLSEPFANNKNVTKLLQSLLAKHDDYIITSAEITTAVNLDVEKDIKTLRVHKNDVARAVQSLLAECDTSAVRYGIVHISGAIIPDDKLLIVDHIHQQMPTARLRAFQSATTPSSYSSDCVIVECVFFGSFPPSDE